MGLRRSVDLLILTVSIRRGNTWNYPCAPSRGQVELRSHFFEPYHIAVLYRNDLVTNHYFNEAQHAYTDGQYRQLRLMTV